MLVDLTPVFAAYFARNRGPMPCDPEARHAPNYGVSASFDDSAINLTLTFRSGSAYCCYEPGCHLNLYEDKRWEWLRQELSARGLQLTAQLELRLEVVVEAGAQFFDFARPDPTRRGWYEFAPEAALHFDKVLREGGELGTEQGMAPDCARTA